MSDLKVSVSRRRTVATLFAAEFSLLRLGWRPNRQRDVLQVHVLLCATYNSPKEELFERARTFQDSLEASYT